VIFTVARSLEPTARGLLATDARFPSLADCALRSALNDHAYWTPDCALGGEIPRAAAWLSIVE